MNHTMTKILAMVVNGRQDDWDLQLPHVELPYQDSVCVATGLAPSEVHNGGLSRLALTVFQRTGVAGQHGVPHDRLLRPGYRPTAPRERYCSQTPCSHRFPH